METKQVPEQVVPIAAVSDLEAQAVMAALDAAQNPPPLNPQPSSSPEIGQTKSLPKKIQVGRSAAQFHLHELKDGSEKG